MKTKLIFAAVTLGFACVFTASAQSPGPSSGKKPNILVIFGDDIGQTNVSAYSKGMMGYWTPNIDRIAKEGMIFTDYYAEQSCTAGRSSFTSPAWLLGWIVRVCDGMIEHDPIRTPIPQCLDYTPPFKFNGKIQKLTLELK
jgi:Sulfatase